MHRTAIIAAAFAILAGPAAAGIPLSNDCGWGGATYEQIHACRDRVKAREAAQNRASIAAQAAEAERLYAADLAARRAEVRAGMADTQARFFADRRKLGIAEADIAESWADTRRWLLTLYAEPTE